MAPKKKVIARRISARLLLPRTAHENLPGTRRSIENKEAIPAAKTASMEAKARQISQQTNAANPNPDLPKALGPPILTTTISEVSNKIVLSNSVKGLGGVIAAAEDDSPKFPSFGKLPIELRLKIWGNSALEPYTVVQREFRNTKLRFSYNRPVPAVLHAYKESRNEFIETDDSAANCLLESRRREHAVYKLSFTGKRGSSPIFFSVDVDSFWGTRFMLPYRLTESQRWSTITGLDIAKSLKHLILLHESDIAADVKNAAFFATAFPALETLTVLLRVYSPQSGRTSYSRYPSEFTVYLTRSVIGLDATLSSEVDRLLDIENLAPDHKCHFEQWKKMVSALISKGSEKYPNWTAPILKIRLLSQFMENEEIIHPAGRQNEPDMLSDCDFED